MIFHILTIKRQIYLRLNYPNSMTPTISHIHEYTEFQTLVNLGKQFDFDVRFMLHTKFVN